MLCKVYGINFVFVLFLFFKVDATATKPGKLAVSERDVALAVLYGTPCIIVLRHQHDAHRSGSAYVCVYTVHK